MRRKVISWMLTAAMIVSMFVSVPITTYATDSYDAEINIVDGTGTGTGWTFTSGEIWINENGSYLVNGGGIQTENRIRVSTGVIASVTLNNVNINVNLPFEVGGTASVTMILKDDSNNIFSSWGGHAGIRVQPSATLTITTDGQSLGNGSLSAYGGPDTSSNHACAGIGGSELEASGTIIIDGGTILAKGGDGRTPGAWRGPGAAGIGGATGSSCGDITINGGIITAIGGGINPEGAGIGGGSSDPSRYTGKITINGGTVRAYSGQVGDSGTGIGFCSSIAFSDTADVQAYSSGNYPAIYGKADASGHSAFLLNFMLDTAVLQDTDITVTELDESTELFEVTLPAKYKNFAATVKASTNYTAGSSDGLKEIVSLTDESTNFLSTCDLPGTALSSISVRLKSLPPIFQSASTNENGTKAVLSFNKTMADPTGKHAQFSVVSGGNGNAVTAANLGTDTKTIELTLTTPIVYGQAVTVDYTPGTIAAADGGMLTAFANQEVTNNVAANVAKIGSIGYPTLAGALAAANDTDTIVLISDITYSNGITADAKNVDIDLNGFNLTVSGVAGHALEAKNNGVLNILDEDGSGVLTVNSSGEYKHCVNAVSGGKVNIKGGLTASLPAGAGSYQNIIGAYADGLGSTINLTGSAFGHMAGIYAQDGAVITVSGNVDGSYYGAFSAYNGSVNVKGNVSGSRALVSDYGGIATVEGDIIGGDHAISANATDGWNPPNITVTGNVTGTGGAAISVSNDADIQITGDVTGYIAASGSPTASPDVTINGDITVNTGFGVSVFYGGTVTINGSILGASPYLRLNNMDISKNDYEISGDYVVYSNTTVESPAPFATNTVRVKIPQGGYTVTIGTLSGGTITASPTSATPGTNINLTITPDTGKQLKAGTLKYNDGNDYSIAGTSFVMPPANVTVTAEFENTLINQAPVITSNWGYNTVYFGENYPYTITVTDAENTSGTKIYSSLDGAEFSVVWTYPGAPATQNITLSPLKGVLTSGSHTLRYYAQDLGGAVSNMLTLTFTVTDKPVSPPISGGSGGSTPPDTGTKITVTTTDGEVSVTGTLTQTNGGAQVVIKNDDFKKVNNADKPAAVNAHLATVVFDKKAMDTIGTLVGSGDVALAVRQVTGTELSAEQRALVGSRPVYDFAVTGAGKTISNFNGGQATVSIPYTLGENEHPHAIVIWYLSDSGKLVRMRGHYDTATKSVTFKTSHFSNFVIGYNPISFQDVPADAWYESAVTFLAARDITTGTGDGKFSPDTILTRGQFIVMLMKTYDIKADTNPKDNFVDAGNTYYTNYLAEAKRLGISAGIGNNMFAPDKKITRQEMFTMLYNALTEIGELPEGNLGKKLSDFSDADSIASWAKNAMTKLVEAEIVSGSNGKISPTNSATRAEMAQVLYNLLTK